ncbi:MAG TPA: hypothetical protein VGD79_02035 [Thermoanaerobaculia bacterium]|jgi:hypothetical protein
MDQQNSNNDWGSTGSTGGGTSSSTSGGSMGGGGMNTGSSSSGLGGGTDTTGGFGVSSATDTGLCPTCGQSTGGGGLEQFLGRLGITNDMMNNLKGQFQNVDIDEYMNTARDYLKDGGSKAQTYAKENPGKVAAGVAALALGAGLLYAAVNRDR